MSTAPVAPSSTTSDSTTSDSTTSDPSAAAAKYDKSLDTVRSFAETYAKRTGTYFCVDPGVTAVVIKGLADHKESLGAALCPCRHYEDKAAEAAAAYWNCPCVPMRERNECHCMLFLMPDNAFAAESQEITMEEVLKHTEA